MIQSRFDLKIFLAGILGALLGCDSAAFCQEKLDLGHREEPIQTKQSPEPNENQDVANKELTALLLEREKALERLLSAYRELSRAGSISIVEVAEIELKLVDAKLELESDKATRVSLREKQLKTAEEAQKLVKARVQVRNAGEAELLHAKAFRLKCQILLLREKLK